MQSNQDTIKKLEGVIESSETLNQNGYDNYEKRLHLIISGLEGLAKRHESGEVFGEICPEDILMRESVAGNVFKNQLAFQKESLPGSQYKSPERENGAGVQPEKPGDYYSYAIVMMGILYGQKAITEKSTSLRIDWQHKPYEINRGKYLTLINEIFKDDKSLLSPSQKDTMKKLILGMLDEDPKKRPSVEAIRFYLTWASLSENYFNFLSGDTEQVSTSDEEKLLEIGKMLSNKKVFEEVVESNPLHILSKKVVDMLKPDPEDLIAESEEENAQLNHQEKSSVQESKIKITVIKDGKEDIIDFNHFSSDPIHQADYHLFLETLTLQPLYQPFNSFKLDAEHPVTFKLSHPIILRESHKWGDVIPEFQSKSVGKGSFGEVYLTTPHLKKPGFGQFEKKELKEKVVKQPLKAVNKDTLKSEFEKTKALFPNTHIPEELGEKPPIMMPYFGADLYAVSRTSENLDWCGYNDCNMRLHLISMGLEHLDEIHQKGFVHRDIKPENMMLLQPSKENRFCDELRFVDMGLAMKVGDVQKGFSGTIEYMAPEQFKANGDPAQKTADYYSYALVMIKMLYGDEALYRKEVESRINWQDISNYDSNIKTRIKLIEALFQEETPLLSQSQRAIMQKLILAMLDPKPEKRPSMEAMRFFLMWASLSENCLQYLEGQAVTLTEDEEAKLFFILQMLNDKKSLRQELLDPIGLTIFTHKEVNQLITLREKSSENNPTTKCFEKFQGSVNQIGESGNAIDSNHVSLVQTMLARVFNATFKSMGLNLDVKDKEIKIDNFIGFAKSYDLVKQDCLKHAAALKNQYGIDYKKADIMNHLDQFYADKIKAISDPVAQIDYYRSLHKSTQAKVKDMIAQGDLNIPSYKLEASFHARINSAKEAENFMKDKPNRHYILYENETGELCLANKFEGETFHYLMGTFDKGYHVLDLNTRELCYDIGYLSHIPHDDCFDENDEYTSSRYQAPIRETIDTDLTLRNSSLKSHAADKTTDVSNQQKQTSRNAASSHNNSSRFGFFSGHGKQPSSSNEANASKENSPNSKGP